MISKPFYPKLRTPSPVGRVASSASDQDISVDYDLTPRANKLQLKPEPPVQPVKDVDPTPRPCQAAPGTPDEHPTAPVDLTRWQADLDDHFTRFFQNSLSSLSDPRVIENTVARSFEIIDRPTQAKIRRLALAVCAYWAHTQFRFKDANVYAGQIVTLVSSIADHLGRLSPHAHNDFLDALDALCIEKSKLTWCWYADVATRGVLPVHRKNLFMRVMCAVAMASHLFRGGQLRCGAVLDGLEYIAIMSPWPDAVSVIYALVHELGPKLVHEQTGWDFVQRLLIRLRPLTQHQAHFDPLCHLVPAINTLVTEWHDETRVTLYQAHPKGNNNFMLDH